MNHPALIPSRSLTPDLLRRLGLGVIVFAVSLFGPVTTEEACAAPPRLLIEHTNGSVRVFWPLSAADFVLEQTPNLVSASATNFWTQVTLPYQTNATHISIILQPASGNTFYRLRGSSTPPQPTGLISWWRAENDTLDSQGIHNGTAQGTVNYAPGAVGQGFSLAGSGYIDIANPTLNAYNTAFTIAAWFVIDNTSGQPSILDFRDSSNNTGFVLAQDGGGNMGLFIFRTTDIGAVTLLPSTGWLLDTPYFIAATFDGSTMTIYRNGSAVATRTDADDTIRAVIHPMLQIGRNVVNGTLWNGQIDEVQFYDHALTPEEVAALMSGSGP